MLSRLCAGNDQKVIDGAVDGLGRTIAAGGGRMSVLHAGMVQYGLIGVFVSIAFMALYFLL